MGGVESDLKRAAAAADTAAAAVASSASAPLGRAKEFANVHTPDHKNKKKIWLSQGTQRMLGIEGHLHGKKFVNHHGKEAFEGSLALVDGGMVCVCVGRVCVCRTSVGMEGRVRNGQNTPNRSDHVTMGAIVVAHVSMQ